MKTYIVWMLLIANGGSAGHLTIIDNLPSRDACIALSREVAQVRNDAFIGGTPVMGMRCIKVERVKP